MSELGNSEKELVDEAVKVLFSSQHTRGYFSQLIGNNENLKQVKEDFYQFLYKRDKPMPMKIMGVIVALFSIGGIASFPFFGIIMALGAGGLIAYQSGIEVNFKDKTYRMITAMGTQGFGSWEPLPEIKCVSIFKTNLVSSTYGRSNASITTRQTVIQVNLATEQNKRIRLFETEEIEEAVIFAKSIAQKLDLNIWDALGKEGKWLSS